MVLPPHFSHLTQPLDVGVFGPLKTHMASALEPIISTEIHRLIKAEWLAAYVEAHRNAFSTRNIRSGFCGTGILLFNPLKVIDRVKASVQNSIIVRGSTPTEFATPFKDFILTSSPLNTDEVRTANATLLSELSSGSSLSNLARRYAQKVVKRSVEDGKSYMVTKALIATDGVTAIKETDLKPYEFATSTLPLAIS